MSPVVVRTVSLSTVVKALGKHKPRYFRVCMRDPSSSDGSSCRIPERASSVSCRCVAAISLRGSLCAVWTWLCMTEMAAATHATRFASEMFVSGGIDVVCCISTAEPMMCNNTTTTHINWEQLRVFPILVRHRSIPNCPNWEYYGIPNTGTSSILIVSWRVVRHQF